MTEAMNAVAPEAPEESNQEAIQRLAKLPPIQYDQVREAEAQKLVVRVATLDREVKKARGEFVENTDMFPTVEPWGERVDGAKLLDDISGIFRRYLVLPKGGAEVMALWVLVAHAQDSANVLPILCITSPTPECGKTTTLSLLHSMLPKPLPGSNLTSSVVYRAIELWQPTLIIDEADSFLRDNEELRGVLNCGHSRALAYVIRNVGEGTNMEPKMFSTWGPKVIALIGKLPATLGSRSIHIEMRRMEPGERVESYRADKLHFGFIASMAARWVEDHDLELRDAEPEMPNCLSGRRADNWRHMLAIADAAGDHWPETARAAAEAMAARYSETTIQVMLLQDVAAIFAESRSDKITSTELIEKLIDMETRPWCEWSRGKPITARQLARLLEPFGITPGTIRTLSKTAKGYYLGAFADAFARYLPSDPSQRHNPQKSATIHPLRSVTPLPLVTDEELLKPIETLACDVVTDSEPPTGDAREVAPGDWIANGHDAPCCIQCGNPIEPEQETIPVAGRGEIHQHCYDAFFDGSLAGQDSAPPPGGAS